MKTITMTGISITDEIHQLDPKITGQFVVWNVTRIQRDADFGMFGPPIRRPLHLIPPMHDAERANVTMQKVGAMLLLPAIVDKPILTVQHGLVRRIVDGNHRICARQLLSLIDFETYVVPPEVEGNYRVRCFEDGKEVSMPYD